MKILKKNRLAALFQQDQKIHRKNDTKILDASRNPTSPSSASSCAQVAQDSANLAPKWQQNGAKMEPTWQQNGAKMGQNLEKNRFKKATQQKKR